MARCLPPSLQGQQSSGTRTQSLSVLQSALEAGAFLLFLAWARKGTPNEATPSAANANRIRSRTESERDMAQIYSRLTVGSEESASDVPELDRGETEPSRVMALTS